MDLEAYSLGEKRNFVLGLDFPRNVLKKRESLSRDLTCLHIVARFGLRMKSAPKDRFEPRPIFVKGEKYWQVHLPDEYRINQAGQRVRYQPRKSYRTKEEALTIAAQARVQARNYGLRSLVIPEHIRRDAESAIKIIEPYGVTLYDACKFYVEHAERERASEKVSSAIEMYLALREKDDLRPRYRKDLENRLERFKYSFGDRSLATISVAEIKEWLANFSGFHRNTFRLRLSALFGYAVEKKWIESNPITGIKKARADSRIGILAPEQFKGLIIASSKQTRPYWLIGGFAGLRSAELGRLEWEDVHWDASLIEVPALKAKTASRRFVQMQPVLIALLQAYKGTSGPVCPVNLRKLLHNDREKASLQNTWPSNALRHSFATYHLAHFKDAARLALELGHTDQGLIFKHYRELVTPAQAAKWWNISVS